MARFHSRPWASDDRTGGPLDGILDALRREVPGLVVERLAVTHAADDDNVYFIGDTRGTDRVQIDTAPDGEPGFLLETSDLDRPEAMVETRDPDVVVATVTHWLTLPVREHR